jgi:hypothetical protein
VPYSNTLTRARPLPTRYLRKCVPTSGPLTASGILTRKSGYAVTQLYTTMVRPQTVHIKNVCWDQLRVDIKHPGYRSAMAILSRLGLVLRNQDGEVEVAIHVSENSDYVEAVWRAVSAETGIRLAVEMLRERPTVSGIEIGKKIGNHLSQQWSRHSAQRV